MSVRFLDRIAEVTMTVKSGRSCFETKQEISVPESSLKPTRALTDMSSLTCKCVCACACVRESVCVFVCVCLCVCV